METTNLVHQQTEIVMRLLSVSYTHLSRKNGWADDCGRIFLYYPICEVVDLLRCGRQKAVNTLRELQYAGLVEIQKQGDVYKRQTPAPVNGFQKSLKN